MTRRFLTLLIALLLAGAVRADITSNLEAWWKLDDNSTTTAVDSSGGSHTLTLANTPTPATGKIGPYCLSFASASSESGSATTWAGIQGTGAKTVACWLKTSTATGGMISWGENTAGKAWREAIVSGAIMLRCTANSRSWGSGLNDGLWHHVAIVKPASANVTTTICYIDNVLTAPASTSGTTTIDIGSSWNPTVAYDQGGTDGYFNGSLDDVRIYSRELSSGDVTELYNWRGISYVRSRVVNSGGTVQSQSQSAVVNQ